MSLIKEGEERAGLEADNRLERALVENAVLKTELSAVNAAVRVLEANQQRQWTEKDHYRERAILAEAERDKAREALRGLVSAVSARLTRGEDDEPKDFERAWAQARAALALKEAP